MKKWIAAACVAVVLVTALSANAAEPKGWKFEITPYAWLAGVEGDVTVGGRTVDFDKSFSDLVNYVDLAGSLLGVVQYDRYLLWGQMDYFSMSTDNLDVQDQPEHSTLDSKMLLSEMAAGYQIDGWMKGQTFDLLIGARNLHIKNDLDIDGVGSFGRSRDLWDPMLVIRPSMEVLPSKITGLRFNPTLAIGGGGDSEFIYELQPQFQYQITDTVAARVGYRRVGYKVKGDRNSDNELNFSLAGLIVGLGVTF